MALTDKNILITPNTGQTADPKIVFSGADATLGPQNITLQVYPTNNGTLSFEGSAGQLFSVTNSLSGTIFSVNDVSGIPSIEVLDTGLVKLAQYSGNVILGTATDNGTDKLQVNGSILGTTVKGATLASTVATGTAPLTVTSTTLVTNLNADLVDGLQVHTGVNNEANKVVRTDGNGYIQAGWINTTSGDSGTTAIDRVYASGDGYIRYYTPANFRQVLDVPTRGGSGASGTWAISITGNAATATSATTAGSAPLLSNTGIYNWNASTLPTSYSLGVQTSFVSDGQGWPNYGSLVNVNTYSDGGGALQLYVPYSPTYGGTGLRVRFGNYDVNSWTAWKTLLASDNYNSYSPTLTGGGASGTWGISITGNAATATNADTLDGNHASAFYLATNPSGFITSSGSITGNAGSVSGLTLTSSANGINPDNVTQNQIGYNSSVSLFGQTDGGLYSSAYSSSWIHQIYGDFRTGQIATRGKSNGTWQAWRTVLDSSNYTSYSPSLTGSGASGTWGINITGNAATASNTSSISSAVGSGYTWTGVQYFQSNLGSTLGSLSNPPLQVFATGANAAFMSFHRGGAYAVNMGLDSDNVFRIGGWSAAANRFQMDMSGNLTMAGNVTAYSDEKLKKDWGNLPNNFIELLSKIKYGTYTRIDSNERQVGVSAQSLQKVLPEAVLEDATGTLAVSYGNAAMVSVVELAKEVVGLKAQIAELKALIMEK